MNFEVRSKFEVKILHYSYFLACLAGRQVRCSVFIGRRDLPENLRHVAFHAKHVLSFVRRLNRFAQIKS